MHAAVLHRAAHHLKPPKPTLPAEVLCHLCAGMSNRVQAAWLPQGVPAKQYDAYNLGITTTDVFGAADVLYDRTLPAVRQALTFAPAAEPHLPVVTGFLGRGVATGATGMSPDMDCRYAMHALLYGHMRMLA